jgi:hypothetical protein
MSLDSNITKVDFKKFLTILSGKQLVFSFLGGTLFGLFIVFFLCLCGFRIGCIDEDRFFVFIYSLILIIFLSLFIYIFYISSPFF